MIYHNEGYTIREFRSLANRDGGFAIAVRDDNYYMGVDGMQTFEWVEISKMLYSMLKEKYEEMG